MCTMRRPCVGISCHWCGCGAGGFSKEQGHACCEMNEPGQVGITRSPSLGSHWNLLSWGTVVVKTVWSFLPLPRPENLIQWLQQAIAKGSLVSGHLNIINRAFYVCITEKDMDCIQELSGLVNVCSPSKWN